MKSLSKYRELWLAAAIALRVAAVATRFPAFATPARLLAVFNDYTILIILALGQMTVILTRSIDLSMASNLAFTGMVIAMLNAAYPSIPVPLLIVLAMVIGSLLGSWTPPRKPGRSSCWWVIRSSCSRSRPGRHSEQFRNASAMPHSKRYSVSVKADSAKHRWPLGRTTPRLA